MRIENVDGVIPQKDLVLVNVEPTEIGGLYLGENEKSRVGQIRLYKGTVEALGPQATDSEHCPGITIGDIAVFSQFAGGYIATNDNKLHKIIRGYDIMATTTDKDNITESTVSPTADRILVESIIQDTSEDGLILSESIARDPALTDIKYGRVLSTGPSTRGGIVHGTVIAFDIHVGEVIRDRTSDDSPELKVIREDDILFIKL